MMSSHLNLKSCNTELAHISMCFIKLINRFLFYCKKNFFLSKFLSKTSIFEQLNIKTSQQFFNHYVMVVSGRAKFDCEPLCGNDLKYHVLYCYYVVNELLNESLFTILTARWLGAVDSWHQLTRGPKPMYTEYSSTQSVGNKIIFILRPNFPGV